MTRFDSTNQHIAQKSNYYDMCITAAGILPWVRENHSGTRYGSALNIQERCFPLGVHDHFVMHVDGQRSRGLRTGEVQRCDQWHFRKWRRSPGSPSVHRLIHTKHLVSPKVLPGLLSVPRKECKQWLPSDYGWDGILSSLLCEKQACHALTWHPGVTGVRVGAHRRLEMKYDIEYFFTAVITPAKRTSDISSGLAQPPLAPVIARTFPSGPKCVFFLFRLFYYENKEGHETVL